MTRTSMRRRALACLVLTLVLAVPVAAEILELRLEYPAASLTTSRDGEFTRLALPGAELLARSGAPALPMMAEQIVLPEGWLAHGVTAVSLASVRIPCAPILPFQPPAILGPLGVDAPEPIRVGPDAAIYAGDQLYPADLAVFRGTGRMRDLRIAGCEIHPVQWDPEAGELILHTEIQLIFDLEPDTSAGNWARGGGEMSRLAADFARATMHGAENLSMDRAGASRDLDPGAFSYVIITETAQLPAYESYAAWKTARGLPATTVTVDWIAANYAGRDLSEQIRNFIIEAVQEWGTSYVLIGGDEQIVPSRISWAFDCEAGFYPNENDLYADLYFAALDGDWDANGNSIFGEVDDDVDLYPEIIVGRAPTDDLAQAQAVVDKFLLYEKTPPAGHMMDAFYFAEVLWNDPYTDSGIGKDMIAERCMGDYEPIERQYASQGTETVASVISYFNNSGPHLTNHAGHANYSIMGCGDGYLSRDDVDLLYNAPYFHVLFSIGCWASAFDYGCIGEHFLVNGNGGAIAFVGNSRYGWGSPGNPGMGYSETYDSDFYAAILSEGLTQFGAAVAWPKILRIPYSQEGNVYRWHQYQVNLFGDPEMRCHTADINAMTLGAPSALPLGATQFTATLTDAGGPVVGADLCLAGDGVYQAGTTDACGQVVFTPVSPDAQILTLTASAPNHGYVEQAITVAGDEPFLSAVATLIDDDNAGASSGNGDGQVGAGETIELSVTVHNYGATAATGVTATLGEDSPHAEISVDTAAYGDIAAGGETAGATAFVFTVSTLCPDDEVLPFTLLLEDDTLGSWSIELPLGEVAADLRFHHYMAEELVGDGDGIIEPGETVALTLMVRNAGSGQAGPMAVTLSTSDTNLTVIQGTAASTEVTAPGGQVTLSPAFQVQISGGCPPTTYGELDLAFSYDEGSDADAFLLAVGEPGLADDMESGEGGWTHSGVNDQWHLEDARSHSGDHSWYCGTTTYANNTSASLLSAEFVIPENPELSFWCYFDVTIYGVDGLFVEFRSDGDWETLGYLGSGGALGGLLFSVDWAEHLYDLSSYAPGATGQLRFRLETDGSDTDEGFYIDDVVIGDAEGTATAIELPCLTGFWLSAPWPNPLTADTQWRLALPRAATVEARVYDLQGRLVRRLASGPRGSGEHQLHWDGRTRRGEPAASGVYFLRVSAGDDVVVRKVVKLR